MHDGSEQGHRVRSLDFGTFTHAVNASTDHWWYRCKKKNTQSNTKKIYSSPLCTIHRLKTGERGKMQWLCLCASIHFICALRNSPCMCAKLTLTTAKLAVTCLRHNNAEMNRPGRQQEWGGDKGVCKSKSAKLSRHTERSWHLRHMYMSVNKHAAVLWGIFSICSGESKPGSSWSRGSLGVFILSAERGVYNGGSSMTTTDE